MTHVPINIDSINWDQILNVQEGGEMDRVFVGQRYMRGYGILGTIGKFLLPIAKNLASTIGTEGVAAGQNILKDVSEGKDFSETLKEHSKKGLQNLSDKIKQCGKGKAGKGKKRTIKKLTFSSYPSVPSSPTLPPPPPLLKKKRRRKPDQLDMF